ncbi:type I restriction-modification system subunit M [Ureaplasma sp. ES3154-GEN]|uniref:type I restriction-modification system subunit M n=1 Tax=Ureaplasma sp. ES3154-GEN TaxID=2984844 RepID=UPI0021E98111|nr:class I SAM-dependent DNA methyltransferase [Ureaplasma sp. ES3154-GEN]MCV3743503.1 type I restriction-modification system subunit M [Ureaplasma sp. ES3154-GEN]
MSEIIAEKVLWGAAEKLRDKCDPADYKNIVLGLVFLKYVSDKYNAKYNELVKYNDGREDDEDYYIAEHVFIVPKNALWSEISKYTKSNKIDPETGKIYNLGQLIDMAFVELEKHNDQLKNILPKTYSKSDLDKDALGELVDFFTNNLNMEETDGDFFGQVYEFYIGAFAKYIPTKGGEFFTPKSLVELMVNILEPYSGRVYDPCCGSGGMFVQCSEFVKQHQGNVDNISIFGQESNPGTWKMAKMNLAIRGLEGNLGPSNGDSFTDDKHKDLQADYILANPPYNLKSYWKSTLEGDSRWVFGRPNDKDANYAWLSLMYSKLSPNKGKAAILMPNGATTSNRNDDYNLRKNMIQMGKVDAIIALPNKLFSNVSISVQCWILNAAKTDKDILFVDAGDKGKLISKKIRVLENEDINLIVDTYKKFKNDEFNEGIPGFAKVASLSEIQEKDYSLNPGRYVGVDESNKLSDEEIKEQLKLATNELLELMKKGEELENKVKEILLNEIK